MSFKAPESLAEQIAKHIGDEIISGRMPGNTRIQEQKVVKDLSVSRGSVREALLILENRHLIDIFPRKGAMVTELTEKSVTSLYAVYSKVLAMLAREVTLVWNDGDLDPVLKELQRMQSLANSRGTQSRMELIQAGFDLMVIAYPIGGNTYLQSVLEDLQPCIHRTYVRAMQTSVEEMDVSINFFATLMKAVLSRDADQAEKIVLQYSGHQMSLVLSSL
jgi:DNA-binding GntR family transcriptional regulator